MKVFHKTRFTGQTTDVKDPFAFKKKKIQNPEKQQLQKVGCKIFISLLEQTSKTTAFDTAQPAQHDHGRVSFTHTPMAMPGPCSSSEDVVQPLPPPSSLPPSALLPLPPITIL